MIPPLVPFPRASVDTRMVRLAAGASLAAFIAVAQATGWHVLMVSRRELELDVLLARG